MTIIEAIKTGKRFKRLEFINWIHVQESNLNLYPSNCKAKYLARKKENVPFNDIIYIHHLLANDWIIEENV